jgi:hypothetical protein
MYKKRSNSFSRWLSSLCTIALFTFSFAVAASETEVSKQLVGIWKKISIDKESGDTETLLIEFKSDGTYSTRLHSKLFGESKNSASGRYSVTNAIKDTFILQFEVLRGDPEMEKKDSLIVAKIRQIDVNTLQNEDGQVVNRVR